MVRVGHGYVYVFSCSALNAVRRTLVPFVIKEPDDMEQNDTHREYKAPTEYI